MIKKITIIIGSLLLLSMVGCSEQETSQSYVERAKQSIAQNKVNDGVIELKNAIKIDAKNSEARFALGQVYLNQGRGLEAVKEFKRALSLKFDINQLIPLYARALLISHQDADIIDLAEKAKTLDGAVRERYLLFKIIAHIKLNELENAKADVSTLEQISKEDISYLVAKAYVKFAEKNIEHTQLALDKALTINPQHLEALQLQGKLSTVSANYAKASEAYSNYLNLQPLSLETELALASSLLYEGKVIDAEKHADKILNLVPNQPYANYIKAVSAIEKKDYKIASEHAERAIQNNMNLPNLKLVAGVSAFYIKNFEQANLHLSALVNYLPVNHFARRMLVVSQIELGIVDNVNDTLEGFETTTDQDAQFISSLGYRLVEVGALDEAQEVMSKADSFKSANANQLLREGVLKMMLNDPSAIEHLSSAIEQDPKLIKAELALAYLAVKKGQYDKAKLIAEKWIEKYPEQTDGHNLLSAISIENKDYVQAKEALNKSLSIDAQNIYALLQLAKISGAEGDEVSEKDWLEKALSLEPTNPRVLRNYFNLTKSSEALEQIKEIYEADKSNLTSILLYGEALAKLVQYRPALNVLNNHQPSNKTPKIYWNMKLATLRALKEKQGIETALTNWRETNPFHIEPVLFLADWYSNQRKYDKALRILNRSFEQQPDNLLIKLVKLQVFLKAQRINEAKRLFEEVEGEVEQVEVRNGLLGHIKLLEKDFTKAAELLEPYYQYKPHLRTALYLISAYAGDKQFDKAIPFIKQCINDYGESNLLNNTLANLYLQSNQQDKALSLYQQMVNNGNLDVVALNNAAWLSMEQGDMDSANNFAEQAFKLAPELADVVDTYGQVLFKSGKKREALEKSKIAYELSKGKQPEIAMNYVEMLILNGRKNEAKSKLVLIEATTKQQQQRLKQIHTQL